MALTQRCAQAEVDRDKARARVAELEREHGSRTDAADPNGTTCARMKWWKDRDDAREDRVAELEAELRSIADAKYTAWDDGYNTPQDFVAWVQNRCRFLLKR